MTEAIDVLVLLGCFGRGVEATGPNQTLLGMAKALRGEYDFRVVAEAVPGDRIGEWQAVAGLRQMPIEPGLAGSARLRRVVRETPHDILITNGLFDRTMTMPLLVMRRLGMVPRKPTLLAPHGELSPGAIDLKSGRKQAWLRAVRGFDLLEGVSLQATTEEEALAIRSVGRFGRPIHVCPNVYPIPDAEARPAKVGDAPLRIVYASRIDEKKNLHRALEIAQEAGVPFVFDIFGPISDERYGQKCRDIAARVPDNCAVTFRGVLAHKDVRETLASYDVMFMPTLGENFGYSIADALLAGTPVLISDRTPWRGLAAVGAGWDLPLADGPAMTSALRDAASWDAGERTRRSAAARAYAIEHLAVNEAVALLRETLRAVGQSGE